MLEGKHPVCLYPYTPSCNFFLFTHPTLHLYPTSAGCSFRRFFFFYVIYYVVLYLIPLLFQPCIHSPTHPDVVQLVHFVQLCFVKFVNISLTTSLHGSEGSEPQLLPLPFTSP